MSYTLTRSDGSFQPAADNPAPARHVWTMRVQCTATGGWDPAVFVLQRGDSNRLQGDVFAAVASVQDMNAYGKTASADLPFYRVDTVDVDCDSPEQAEDFWALVQAHVQDLVTNLQAAATLATTETVTIT